jgi:hypothetical protein
MGTTLTGTEIKDTYDSLIKVTDNGPISGTAKYLSDGLGNDSVLALSTAGVGIGTASPTVALEVDGAVKFSTSGASGPDLSFGNIGGSTFINNIAGARNYYGAYENVFTNGDNSVEFARITNTGNVGIGTSGPTHLVQIYGASLPELRLGDASAQIQMYTNTTDGVFGTVGGSPLVLRTNATERLRITSTGNVGIGTSTPLSLLHISQASADTTLRVGNNAGYDQFIYFNGGNDWSLGMDYSNSNAFVLSNASTVGTNDRLVVTTAGNVGIGTSSPDNALEVAGAAGTTTSLVKLTNSSAAAPSNITQVSFELANSFSGVNTDVVFGAIKTNSGNYESDFYISTSSGTSSVAERVRVTASGNVGIGTDAPESKLHVAGSAAGSDVTLYIDNAAASTLNNSSRLKFSSDSGSSVSNGGAELNCINVNAGNGAVDLLVKSWTGSAYTEKVRITAAGNVGIGTDAPAQLLTLQNGNTEDVSGSRLRMNMATNAYWELQANNGGTSADRKFIINTSAAAGDVLTLTQAGNVGIGTSAPEAKVHIKGLAVAGSVGMFIENEASSTINNSADIFFGTWGGSTVAGITNARISAVNVNAGNAESNLDFYTYNGASSGKRVSITQNGLTFNGDTAAANALDDYEEGTWTMSVAPSSSGTITLDGGVNAGSYTKIGRQVTVTGLAEVLSVSSPVGTIVIFSGLPFAIGSRNLDYDTRLGGSVTVSSAGTIIPRAFAGFEDQSSFNIYVDASTIAAGNQFLISFTYIV